MNLKKMTIMLLSILLMFSLNGCGKKKVAEIEMPEVIKEESIVDSIDSSDIADYSSVNEIDILEIFPTKEGYIWKYDGPIETGKSVLLYEINETEQGIKHTILSIKDDASGMKSLEELMSKTIYTITNEEIIENGNAILKKPIEVGNKWHHQHVLKDSGETRYGSTEITKIEDDKIYTKTAVENLFGYPDETYYETNVYVVGSGIVETKYTYKGIEDMEMGYNIYKTYFEPYDSEGQMWRDKFDSLLISDDVRANPIIAYNDYLIGGTFAGKWLGAYSIAPKLTGSETYKVYGLEGYRIDGIGGIPQKESEPFEWYKINVLTPFGDQILDKREANNRYEDYFLDQLILSTDWNPMPRKVEQIKILTESYINIVEDVLSDKNINGIEVDIKQVMKTDLEGDGLEEIIITASSYKAPINFDETDERYSLIVLQKIIDGQYKNILIAGDYQEEGNTESLNYLYYVPFILDLNGDGRMEIVTEGMYYEGRWIDVIDVNEDVIQSVLADGPQI